MSVSEKPRAQLQRKRCSNNKDELEDYVTSLTLDGMHVDRGNTTPAYLTVDGKYHKAFLGIQLSFLVDSLCGFSVPQNRYGIFLLLPLPKRTPRDTKCPISLSHMNSQLLRVLPVWWIHIPSGILAKSTRERTIDWDRFQPPDSLILAMVTVVSPAQ